MKVRLMKMGIGELNDIIIWISEKETMENLALEDMLVMQNALLKFAETVKPTYLKYKLKEGEKFFVRL